MAPRRATPTIPGSSEISKRWKTIINHKDKSQDRRVAMELLFFKDRESIAISAERQTEWDSVQKLNSYLIEMESNNTGYLEDNEMTIRDDYRIDYIRKVLTKELIPNLRYVVQNLIDPNHKTSIVNLQELNPYHSRFHEGLAQFYELYINYTEQYFKANPNLQYVSLIETSSFLNVQPLYPNRIDLPQIIFDLFDNNPYCHFTYTTQRNLGVSDWKARRKPSQYSLRILGLFLRCYPEFSLREPANVQELINALICFMIMLMRRIDYHNTKEILSPKENQPDVAVLYTMEKRFNDYTQSNLNIVYYAYKIGEAYLQNRPEGPNIAKRYELAF